MLTTEPSTEPSNAVTWDGQPVTLRRAGVDDITDRKLDVEARLKELRRQRGIALLDNKPFDGSEISALEDELDALTEAEGEATRRQRAAEATELAKRREAARTDVRLYEQCRQEAIKAAELAALDLYVALQDVSTYCEKLSRSITSLGGRPWETTSGAVRERLSQRLTVLMRPLLGRNPQQSGTTFYGSIEFPEPQETMSGEWVPAEAAAVAAEIKQILQGE
ncbi:hypothetical protein [Rhizobium sp. 21-4511-3d]